MKIVRAWQPRPRQWWGLGLAVTLSAAPHLLRLPLWLTAIWLLAVGWRMSLGVQGRARPALLIRLLLTLAAAVALYLHFGTIFGRDAGSALLVMMVGLKLLELKRRRDATLLILLCYLLLAVQFMFDQGIPTVLYVLLAGVGVTAVRIAHSNPAGGRSWHADLSLAARMLTEAVPLMLLLFLLFPRLPGPLWSMPSDAHAARTGLSGEMEPGRISSMALSEAVAFRARFEDRLPSPQQRYWRGPVFELTDGRRWWAADADLLPGPKVTPLPITPRGAPYRYSLTLEPSKSNWIPALEMTTTLPPQSIRLASLEMKSVRAHDDLQRYELIAYPEYLYRSMDRETRLRNLRLPPGLSGRVRALAQGWRQGADKDSDVVIAALEHFHQQPFVYSLRPPLLGADPVDEFLFETRRGFCEHYASAFTLLMRAAGLPARVVTGYQGGEVNPMGDYLIVRQSDAHAWAEVWIEGHGWLRVDPTAAVAPERIEHRIDLGRAAADGAVRFQLDDDHVLVRAWRGTGLALDALNNGWNQWVLSYGPDRQRDVFARLGMQQVGWHEVAWSLLLGGAGVTGLLAWMLLRQRRPIRDPIQRVYRRFLQRLSKAGIPVPPNQGPRELLRHLEALGHPALDQMRRIIHLYITLRYTREAPATALRDLRRAVRRLRLAG